MSFFDLVCDSKRALREVKKVAKIKDSQGRLFIHQKFNHHQQERMRHHMRKRCSKIGYTKETIRLSPSDTVAPAGLWNLLNEISVCDDALPA